MVVKTTYRSNCTCCYGLQDWPKVCLYRVGHFECLHPIPVVYINDISMISLASWKAHSLTWNSSLILYLSTVDELSPSTPITLPPAIITNLPTPTIGFATLLAIHQVLRTLLASISQAPVHCLHRLCSDDAKVCSRVSAP